MIHPIHPKDYYTKTDVAEHIYQVANNTFKSYIESGKVFPPSHVKPNQVRPHYTLLEVLLLSIMAHGSVKMNLIRPLVESKFQHPPALITNYIRCSFELLNNYIAQHEKDPVDIHPYLTLVHDNSS